MNPIIVQSAIFVDMHFRFKCKNYMVLNKKCTTNEQKKKNQIYLYFLIFFL